MIVGIDLGTTNSAIAYINKNGEPEIIPNSEGDRTTPSVTVSARYQYVKNIFHREISFL